MGFPATMGRGLCIFILSALTTMPVAAQSIGWQNSSHVNLRAGLGAPDPRVRFGVAWTGRYLAIVAGGGPTGVFERFKDGGLYDSLTDTWISKPNLQNGVGAPQLRTDPILVWTGTHLIAFGGQAAPTSQGSGLALADGGVYDLATDTWLSRPNLNFGANGPSSRLNHFAAWTGNGLIVYGGHYLNRPPGVFTIAYPYERRDGAVYDPMSDQWTVPPGLSDPGPGVRVFNEGPATVWTGHGFIGQGDWDYEFAFTNADICLSGAGHYDLATGTWLNHSYLASGVHGPSKRRMNPAVWTGTHYISFGGQDYFLDFNNGGAYSPSQGLWLQLQALSGGGPVSRTNHTCLWTGSGMLVWGGSDFNETPPQSPITTWLNDGAILDHTSDVWGYLGLLSASAPTPRQAQKGVFTGSEVIIFGGVEMISQTMTNGTTVNTGAVFIPPRVAPTVRNLGTTDIGGSASNPVTVSPGERLKHRVVCYGTPEAIVIPSNLPSWLTVGFGGPTQLVAAGTGLGNGGQNGEPPGTGAPFNPWFSAEGGTADGQWIHGTPTVADVGVYAIQLHAHNGVHPDSGVHTLYIEVLPPPGPPSFTSPTPPGNAVAEEQYFEIVSTTGNPPVSSIQLTGPNWLSYSGGLLIGTPPIALSGTTQGPFVLTASNGHTPDAVQTFNIYVDYSRFDVNRDKQVNVADVQHAVNIILTLQQQQYQWQADTDRNGVVNILDVQKIVLRALNP